MTEIHWRKPIDGKFGKPGDWAGGVVPGPSDDAILDAAGGAFTVTAHGETVASLQLAANATLDITAGVFTAAAGTGSGANAGVISITGSAALAVGGAVDNAGLIAVAAPFGAPGSVASLVLSADTTLTGGGTVMLDNVEADQIVGNGVTLTNVDNTISGAGHIGSDKRGFTLVNEAGGVIDGNGGGAEDLIIGPLEASSIRKVAHRDAVINDGLIEASGSADLIINQTDITGAGGRIAAAGDGAFLFLEGCTVAGQTLSTNGESALLINKSEVTAAGTIQNAGEILLYNDRRRPGLSITGTVSLTGGGRLLMGDRYTTVEGATANSVLINVDNTIDGAGRLGDGRLTLINQAGGVIDATPFKGPAPPLVIDTGARRIMNAGLMEASSDGLGPGSLVLRGAVVNTGTLAANGGTITAFGAVTGAGVATIDGGALDFTSSFDEDVVFTGATGLLELARSTTYAASITGFSATGGTSLDLGDIGFVGSGEASFSGTAASGVLTVTDGTHTARITLIGDYLSVAFTASADDRGGTIVAASTPGAPAPAAPAQRFVAAAAGLGRPAGESILGAEAASLQVSRLGIPRASIA